MATSSRVVRRATDFSAEVEWGTAWEVGILKRWADSSSRADDARGFIKAGDYDDFDFVIFASTGLVLCYLEVKRRRTAFSKFGDAIFPRRKREFALMCKQKQRVPMIGVTEYGCGTLVEVDLATKPAREGTIERRDRPGNAVPHVFFEKKQMKVLVEAE